MMNRKERYRLYKSGRRWVAVLLVTAAISGGLAMAVPVVQAADGGQADVTQAGQTDTEKNIAALKAAVYAGGWQDLTIGKTPETTYSLSTYLENAERAEPGEKEAALQEVWGLSSTAISLDAMLKELNVSNITTESNQALLTNYGSAPSPIAEYQPNTNSFAMGVIADQGNVSETQPTPNYAQVLETMVAYVKETAKPFAQTNWQRSKGDLAEALTAGNYNDLETPNGTALKDLVAQVADETSLNKAWQEAAAAIKLSTAQKSLGLSDTTAPANKRKLEKFWAMPSTPPVTKKKPMIKSSKALLRKGRHRPRHCPIMRRY